MRFGMDTEKKYLLVLLVIVMALGAIVAVYATAPAGAATHGTLYADNISKKSDNNPIKVNNQLTVAGTNSGVNATATGANSRGVIGKSTVTGGIGVEAIGAAYGVNATGRSSGGSGVEARGISFGVRANATDSDGIGVYGIGHTGVKGFGTGSGATFVGSIGVYGQGSMMSISESIGVFGEGILKGVAGRSLGSSGYGVHGTASGAQSYGVFGEATNADSAGSYGVRGEAKQANGYGVSGRGYSLGVVGIASTTSTFNPSSMPTAIIGVYGLTPTVNGRGVFGEATGGIGVYGTGITGVYATGTNAGVSATATANSGVGVSASATGTSSVGVLARGAYMGVQTIGTEDSSYGVWVRMNGASSTGVYIAATGASSTALVAMAGGSTNSVGVDARGGNTGVKAAGGSCDFNAAGAPSVAHYCTNGADVAEYFTASGALEPGDVVVIDTNNKESIKKSTKAYDTLAAGVVSTSPAMALGYEDDSSGKPLALAGRVPVKVSAENGPIRIGDILTTSNTAGYAMKCDDRARCSGAIIGKALEPLASGKGKISVLIALS